MLNPIDPLRTHSHTHTEFKKADFDKNGALSREEVVSFLHGLKLGLGPKELERFSHLADFNGDGVVVRVGFGWCVDGWI